MGNSREEIN
jgi:hypothetical protein